MRVVAFLLVLLYAVTFCGSPADAAEQGNLGETSSALRTTRDDGLHLLTSPLRLTPERALIVGAIGAGIGGLSLADRAIQGRIQRRWGNSLRDSADVVSVLGSAPVLFGLNVTAIVVGKGIKDSGDDPKFLDSALVAAESQLLTLAFSETIALASARSRPSEARSPFQFKFGRDSFPSSHASQAFAVAAVFADRYDPPVPAIAYGFAGLVGVARIIQDKHWASDVVAGAVLGWAIGKTLSLRHSEPRGVLDFHPFIDPMAKQYGVLFGKEF